MSPVITVKSIITLTVIIVDVVIMTCMYEAERGSFLVESAIKELALTPSIVLGTMDK